ncbi:MAG TPA: VOC family protein [Anaerolineales bacterium]|nr:VOC family protein [Anaerolineales bacterium]
MKIGHLRFKVRDVERAIVFYTGHLKMTLTERVGDDYAFLSSGDAHHEIALMKVEGTGPSPSPESTGFEHLAFELPDKRTFAEAFLGLSKAGVSVKPIDNGISWAMYFADPDGNRIELFCDNRAIPGGRPLWGGVSDDLDVEAIKREGQA